MLPLYCLPVRRYAVRELIPRRPFVFFSVSPAPASRVRLRNFPADTADPPPRAISHGVVLLFGEAVPFWGGGAPDLTGCRGLVLWAFRGFSFGWCLGIAEERFLGCGQCGAYPFLLFVHVEMLNFLSASSSCRGRVRGGWCFRLGGERKSGTKSPL